MDQFLIVKIVGGVLMKKKKCNLKFFHNVIKLDHYVKFASKPSAHLGFDHSQSSPIKLVALMFDRQIGLNL